MGQFNTIPPNPFPPSSESAGNGGSNPYVLPVASANTLGGVKVGNGLSIDANGVLSADSQNVNFSTNEVSTGVKWIDGKEIFVRTFANLSISMTKDVWVDLGVSLSDIDYWRIENEFMNGRQYPLLARDNNGALEGLCQYDVTLTRFTMYYTKAEL